MKHPLAPWIGIWAHLVSFSRIYLGVHYSSDVAGGIAVGFLSAVVATYIL
ncbi:MAG: phosphatase PAP2 family protein [Pseudobdellovibrionaceae bacterium]